MRQKQIEITDVLTPEGAERIEVGQVLVFTEKQLKVVRKNNGRVWAVEAGLLTPDEFQEMMDSK